ncbi:transporter substrate-binding domain-containing protein [Desulfobacterales bacterium HSG17]|nr:transporter substrate-binding domain-containing protein [Desulfobacterales bacterium HSG17]
MNHKRALIFIVIFYLIHGSSILCAETIILFGNQSKPPKAYFKDEKPAGILVDIVKYAGEKMDINFEVHLVPWKRAQHQALMGKGGIIGFAKTPKRQEEFEYAEYPMYIDETLLITTKDNTFEFEDINDLEGKKIIQIRGASHGKEFEQSVNKIFKLTEVNTNKRILQMLLGGRADVAIINPGLASLRMVVERHPSLLENKNKFVALKKPLGLTPNHLAFAKHMKMTKFLKHFSQVMKDGYDSGEIPKIIERYN